MANQVIERRHDNVFDASTSVQDILQSVLSARGLNHSSHNRFTTGGLHHYSELKGVQHAADLLAKELIAGSRIMVVGDFDADGATSVALCMRALASFGATDVEFIVPNRFDYGYGLSVALVDEIAKRQPQLIITVDSGISCYAGVAKARELGMKVVITDHHLAPETLPPANAIVNPNQPGCAFPSKSIAGVGVAFYLMAAVKQALLNSEPSYYRRVNGVNLANLLDLVALGTVADVVQLDSNNQILVHQGLQRIRLRKSCIGISAILAVSGRTDNIISSTDLAFNVAPRLNAAGRLEDMSVGIRCLMTDDEQQAKQLAARLDSINTERKTIQQQMLVEAEQLMADVPLEKQSEQTKQAGIVICSCNFHQGIIGIVAGRLKEQFQVPAVVFAEGSSEVVKGSARSIDGIHIRDILEEINVEHPNMIDKFGGHAMAAGLSLSKTKVASFTTVFREKTALKLVALEQHQRILSDGCLPANVLTPTLARDLKLLAPWGQGLAEPLFDGDFRVVQRKVLKDKHLKMTVACAGQLFDAIAFNIDPRPFLDESLEHIRLVYQPDINRFKGKQQLQLIIRHLEWCPPQSERR